MPDPRFLIAVFFNKLDVFWDVFGPELGVPALTSARGKQEIPGAVVRNRPAA
jgi:hypothetical protein